jgi:LETM1 and EF-hand domain-containing protein 1, mitochondrial
LAILVPQRTYATDTTAHGSDGGAFPPPGFNVNEAKKAPPPSKQTTQASTNAANRQPNEQCTVSKTEPTSVDKTKALEAMTLSELAESQESEKRDEKAAAKKEEEKKLTLGQKIKKEIQHYWDGTKLLATEVKISSKLALKMAAGYELSRRENRQVSIPYLIANPLGSQTNISW